MKILIIFALPKMSVAIVQSKMLGAVRNLNGVTIHGIYAAYPGFLIDVDYEQELLEHDLVVLQHPFYWYSAPAIITEWLDLVLEHDWAYGARGTKVHGKFMMQAISTGGPEHFYKPQGKNCFEIRELLNPFNDTAYLCGMAYLESFGIFLGRRIPEADLNQRVEKYRDLIIGLRDGKLAPLKNIALNYTLPANFALQKT